MRVVPGPLCSAAASASISRVSALGCRLVVVLRPRSLSLRLATTATNDVAARAVAAVVCARVFAVPSDACGGAEAAGLTSSSIARAMSSQLVFAAPVAEAPSWLVESAERVSSTDSMHMPDDLRAATDASSVLWLHAGLRDVRVCSSSALTPSVRASSFRLTRSVGLSGSNGSKSSLMTDTS